MQCDMMTLLDVLGKIAWVFKIVRIFHEYEGRIENQSRGSLFGITKLAE